MLIPLIYAIPMFGMPGMSSQNPMVENAMMQTAMNPMSQMIPPPPRESGVQEGWKKSLLYSGAIAGSALGLGGIVWCLVACRNKGGAAKALRSKTH